MTIAEQPLATFLADLAAKTPVPGGGAAAAIGAALGCASAAMACRYTSGPRHAVHEAEAAALAERLDALRSRALALADADATAYADVRSAKASKDEARLRQAEHAAAQVPSELIALCQTASAAVSAFRPRCNPWLVSDIDTALHLLSGSARAALATLRINNPSADTLAAAEAQIAGMNG